MSLKKIFALFAVVFMVVGPAHATTIQEVTSHSGVTAWLVEDHKLPLIAMHFAFRGGVEQDPVAKQGLTNLTMELLTEGAGPYDAAAFQQQLADNSIALHFNAGRDALSGTVKSLSADKDKAFELLHFTLTSPHFDPKDIERLRAGQLAALRSQLGNPNWQARYALFQYIFGDHPYGERRFGSVRTLAAITQRDIKNFAAEHLAQDNLVVAVAGDITPNELAAALDRVFGDLPRRARLAPVGDISVPQQTAVILVPREGTQTELLFAMPGPKRDDPDWHAAEIANYILGGGGFSSRLMQDVRDKKGLTYGIETGLSPMEYGGLIAGEAATDNPKTGEAWDIATATMRHFYEDSVTEKEIAAAKDYLTGELPLAMTSTDKIAGLLVGLQLDHLGINYLDRRNDMIRQVTPDDIERVIRRWFNPDGLTLAMVGKPEGITPTQTRSLVRE
jgi:zinc protease